MTEPTKRCARKPINTLTFDVLGHWENVRALQVILAK